MKMLLLLLGVALVAGAGDLARGPTPTPEQRLALAKARGRHEGKREKKPAREPKEPKEPKGTKIDSTQTVNLIKNKVKDAEGTLKGISDAQGKVDEIYRIIGEHLDGDDTRENNEANRDLIYAKLNKKMKESTSGFFNNLFDYSATQVAEKREAKKNELWLEAQTTFIADFNAKRPGETPYTIDQYDDAVLAVKEAKAASRKAVAAAKGEGKLKGDGKKARNAKKAYKQARKASNKFNGKSKYQKWLTDLQKANNKLNAEDAQLDNAYNKVGQACQRIKIDIRNDEIPKNGQLDEFVERLTNRGLEKWAEHILYKNRRKIVVCQNKKIDAYYMGEYERLQAARTAATNASDNARIAWENGKFEKGSIKHEGERNEDKRVRLANAMDAAKIAYDNAVAEENATKEAAKKLIIQGLADVNLPKKNKINAKAKQQINKKQGKSRFAGVDKTP